MRDREVAVAELLAEAAAESGKPLVVHTMYASSPAAHALRAAGVPVYRVIESAVDAVAALIAGGAPVPPALPAFPPAAPPLTDAGYPAARAALAEAGVPFGAARTVIGREDALAAAEELGYPVVLKALGRLHKSDAGGVVIGLRNERELATAIDRPLRAARAGVVLGRDCPRMSRRDSSFSSALAAIHASGRWSWLRQVDFMPRRCTTSRPRSLPSTRQARRSSIRSLGSAALLTGARGRPPLDVSAAARAVVGAVALRSGAPGDSRGRGQPASRPA